MFKKIIDWFLGFFQARPINRGKKKSLPPVHFETINVVSKPPKNQEVVPHNLYCAVSGDKPKWVLFHCPCGCGEVVTLSLQGIHKPNWALTKMDSGRPTLYPSVWRDKGCFSHFWVKGGRVYWCADTGKAPHLFR